MQWLRAGLIFMTLPTLPLNANFAEVRDALLSGKGFSKVIIVGYFIDDGLSLNHFKRLNKFNLILAAGNRLAVDTRLFPQNAQDGDFRFIA